MGVWTYPPLQYNASLPSAAAAAVADAVAAAAVAAADVDADATVVEPPPNGIA